MTFVVTSGVTYSESPTSVEGTDAMQSDRAICRGGSGSSIEPPL